MAADLVIHGLVAQLTNCYANPNSGWEIRQVEHGLAGGAAALHNATLLESKHEVADQALREALRRSTVPHS